MQWKPRTIGYWVATGILALAFLAGGAAELASVPAAVSATLALGYPPYFLTILGIWKLLSVPALLAPRLPRLKEWAYAGIAFDLSGAVASHLFSGDGAGAATPFVLLVIAAASWALRPPARTWTSNATQPARHDAPEGSTLGAWTGRASGS
jgi:hypothetical protein